MPNNPNAAANLLPGGVPGNRGGGRPKNEWKEICRDLVSSEERIVIAREILADKTHPAWITTMKWFGEQGYGKPTEESTVSMSVKFYEMVDGKDWTEEV